MAGTLEGGKKAAQTNKARHGSDFYKNIGSKGGANGHTGGFAAKTPCNCSLIYGRHTKPMCAGKLGGRVSSRTKEVKE